MRAALRKDECVSGWGVGCRRLVLGSDVLRLRIESMVWLNWIGVVFGWRSIVRLHALHDWGSGEFIGRRCSEELPAGGRTLVLRGEGQRVPSCEERFTR